MSHWAGIGTQAPISCVAARSLGLGRERGRKAGAQPGSASVHHQEHHQAGPAQNSSPDARKYFILLCFPTKQNKHSQISMGPDSKEGEREQEQAWPPTEKSGFSPFSSFLKGQDFASWHECRDSHSFPSGDWLSLGVRLPFPRGHSTQTWWHYWMTAETMLGGFKYMTWLCLWWLTSHWVAWRGFLSPWGVLGTWGREHWYLLRVKHGPGTQQEVPQTSSHLTLTTSLWGVCCHFPFYRWRNWGSEWAWPVQGFTTSKW